MRQRELVMLVLVALSPVAVTAQEWTRFRGPNGSGISDATTVPVTWMADDYNWKMPLPGNGHSSPVVWGERVFVTSADLAAGQRYLLCLKAGDGSQLWRHDFPLAKHAKHRINSFATGTPACDGEQVYVVWQAESGSALHALNHDGQEVWKYELGAYKGDHGPGASPIVFEDLVIVCHDHEGPSFRLAVDRRTGEKRWSVPRPGRRACYSTPCVYRPADGAAEIICTHAYEGITSLDPASGHINWDIKPFGDFQQRAVGSPIVAGDLVLGSSGFTTAERNLVAVRPAGAAGNGKVDEVYRVTRGAPHLTTPLEYQGLLFLWDDTGIVMAVRAADGSRVWQKRVGGTFYSSPVCVNGKLYGVDRDGVVAVIAAADKFEELGRTSLGEPTFATPAVSGGVMYLRTESTLFSLGGPARN